MTFLDLEKALNERSVTFRYTKVNGSIRKAVGTTNIALIPEEFRPVKDTEEDIHVGYVRYFDLEENGWRTFVKDNFISFV